MSESRIRRSRLALAPAILLLSLPALAIEGKVVDEAGQPVAGAKICYVAGSTELHCVASDAAGVFDLPESSQDRIRISMPGFLPRTLPAVSPRGDIALDPAASLELKLTSTDGSEIEKARVMLIQEDGRRRGPLPVNRHGLRLRTIEPGTYRFSVTAEGFRQVKAQSVELKPRKQTSVEVMMEPDAGPPPG